MTFNSPKYMPLAKRFVSCQYMPLAERLVAHQNISSFQSNKPIRRTGLTLIEIMIALTMTLIILGAMMKAFQFASGEMRQGRALMELANRVRSAEGLLRTDLANPTVEPRPYTQTTAPNGYFEYIEGAERDGIDSSNVLKDESYLNNYLGDVDDILALTVRATPGQSFRGRSGSGVIESSLAEVVWFTTWTDLDGDLTTINFDETVRVHRRVLLIRPDLNNSSGKLNEDPLPWEDPNDPEMIGDPEDIDDPDDPDSVETFFETSDISARVVPTSGGFDVIANNLTDLALRKNRFCHEYFLDNSNTPPDPVGFYNMNRTLLADRRNSSGDDILLTDVTGFDLKVYSPNATVNPAAVTGTDIILEPGDVGFDVNVANGIGWGAFVDLNHPGVGWFNGLPYGNNYAFSEWVYDTWSPAYESDGIDQDGVDGVDQATDGLDSDGSNGVDDTGERETLPPYPYPIRGMKVSIRLIEKGTKQVHQTSIIQSFVPE